MRNIDHLHAHELRQLVRAVEAETPPDTELIHNQGTCPAEGPPMKMSLISLVVCLVLSTYAGASHMLQVNDKQRLLQKVVTNKSSIWRSILNSHMRFKHKLTADQLASSKRLRPFSLAHCVPEGMRVVPVASGAYNMVVHHNDTISDIIESSGMLDETSVKDIP